MDELGVGSPDRFAGYTHNHLAQAIGQLDTKVSIPLGLTSGALVYLVQNMSVYAAVNELLSLRMQASLGAHDIIAVIAGLFLGLSFLTSLYSIMPRFGRARGSIIFFKGIARTKSAEEFADKVTALPGEDLTRAVLADAHSLAKIAKRKAFPASMASLFIGAGLPFLIIAAVLRSALI